MKKSITLALFLYCSIQSIAQIFVKGSVTNAGNQPVALANVYLKNIFDGSITDEHGKFSFYSKATGNVLLVISAVSYKTFERSIELKGDSVDINIQLITEIKDLGEVRITAGAFEASDKKRGVILKPRDIVTTAGAGGDIYGALQTLPGVTPANTETGLFVRGGNANESKTIIDGLIVSNPFFGDVPDIPSRARFSPFGFSGIIFSTGGYSAEYGQALSSVLILNSANEVQKDVKSLSLSVSGTSFSLTNSFKNKSAIFSEVSYTNLKPLYSLIKQNSDWLKPPEGYGTTIAYVSKADENNSLRIQARYQQGSSVIYSLNADVPGDKILFQNKSTNFSSYASYTRKMKNKWNLFTGIAFQYDDQQKKFNENKIPQIDLFLQIRYSLQKRLSTKINFKTGIEIQQQDFKTSFNQYKNSFNQTYNATFAETDIKISNRIVAKTGVRAEYSFLNSELSVGPRVALAFKTGIKSQISLAYGHFYQNPENQYLARNNKLDFEKAVHYLINYQWLTDKYTFRVEAYYKDYKDLITYSGSIANSTNTRNNGNGYARGIDVFWRDNRGSFKNFDYWISYGFIKSERIFRNFTSPATPSFAPSHIFNCVGKYEIPKIRFAINATYTFSSGKTYYNPVSFSKNKTNNYQNFSVSGSYMTSLFNKFSVLYVTVNNVFNIKNVLGYLYSGSGTEIQEITPPAYRSFFAGVSISL